MVKKIRREMRKVHMEEVHMEGIRITVAQRCKENENRRY